MNAKRISIWRKLFVLIPHFFRVETIMHQIKPSLSFSLENDVALFLLFSTIELNKNFETMVGVLVYLT